MELSARIDNLTVAVLCLVLVAYPLHELGHLLALRLLGERGRLGGLVGVVVKIPTSVQGRGLAMVAAAGPCANLLIMWAALRLGWQAVAQANFVLAAVNLLPFLPLDGGRMILGLFSGVLAWRRLAAALLFGGRSAAIALVLCVYYFGLSGWLVLAALWLYLAAMLEGRRLKFVHMAGLTAGRGRRLPERKVVVKRNLPLYQVMREFSPAWQNMVYYKGRKIDGDWLIECWERGKGATLLADLQKIDT